MRGIEIGNGTTVAHNQILKAPLVTQNLLQQTIRTTTRVIIQSLIGTHHLTYITLGNQILKGRHIRFPEITDRHIRQVGRMTSIFRTAMYGVVLGTSPQFAILRSLRTLQTTYHGITHDRSQIRIFAIGLLSPAPSWVTEDVHIRSPYRQTAHLHILATEVIQSMVVLSTELRRSNIKALIKQVGIKRRSHCHGLWEHGDVSHVSCSMQRLAPPEELLDTQTGDSRTLVQHQLGFFFQRQA